MTDVVPTIWMRAYRARDVEPDVDVSRARQHHQRRQRLRFEELTKKRTSQPPCASAQQQDDAGHNVIHATARVSKYR